jgi:hypothetical protein
VTAPFRLPSQGPSRNPFDGLDAPSHDTNPFNGLDTTSQADAARHKGILARNEAGKARDDAQAQVDNAPLFTRFKNALVGTGRALKENPVGTLASLASAPVKSLGTAVLAPGVGEARGNPNLSKGGNSAGLTPEQIATPYDAAHGGVTGDERAAGVAQTLSNIILPGTGLPGAMLAGASYMPEDPVVGAGFGAALHGAVKGAGALALPERVVPPRLRLNETSEPLKASEFRTKLGVDNTAPIETSERPAVAPVAGLEPTALPARRLKVVPRNPKGFTSDVNPFDGLDDSLGKQKPIATEAPADVLTARAETLNDPMRPRRRIVASPSDTPDVAPAPVAEPVAAEPAPAPAEPIPSYPEGMAMGGNEGRIPRLDQAPLPKADRAVGQYLDKETAKQFTEPTPEGAAPAPKAAAPVEAPPSATADPRAPNKYRGHTNEELAHAALDAQAAIEEAQKNLGYSGETLLKDNESTGESRGDQTARESNKGLTLKRATDAMAKIEHEFALRGIRGQDLYDTMDAAREQRMEREGMSGEDEPAMAKGTPSGGVRAQLDRMVENADAQVGRMHDAADARASVPQGEPRDLKPGETLLNRDKFSTDPAIQQQLAESEAKLLEQGKGKRVVHIAEGLDRARAFAKEVGLDPLQIDGAKAGKLSGEQLTGLAQSAQLRMAQIAEWSKRLADPATPPEMRSELSGLINDAAEARDHMLDAVSKGRSQKGRDLNFLKQMTEHSLDPDVWEMQARRLAKGRILSDETISDIRRFAKEAAEACGS